jgi:type I restriction enzyme S subunit
MAAGFPVIINGVYIRTSEALYQLCRFPHIPDLQKKIINEKSPMTAKMITKPYRKETRSDWNNIRINVMRWCLRVKLAQNWDSFSKIILSTNNKPIVELSKKDPFWGAQLQNDGRTLIGMNVLGRLIMELRDLILSNCKLNLLEVEPMQIDNFFIFGRPILKISNQMRTKTNLHQAIKNEENFLTLI